MIYYPLSVLMLAGIKEILIISAHQDIPKFEELLGDGSDWGIKLKYKIQPSPDGLAQAFILGEEFIGNDNVSLILGDNIFYGQGLSSMLQVATSQKNGATVFAFKVTDPERFAVVELDNEKNAINIQEKPSRPKSNFAVTGLYFYDNHVINIAKNVKPSDRGELEITSINEEYLKRGLLKVQIFGRGFTWLDTGTHKSLLDAGVFVHAVERRHGYKVACIEEISFRNGWISKEKLIQLSKPLKNSGYGEYLLDIAQED